MIVQNQFRNGKKFLTFFIDVDKEQFISMLGMYIGVSDLFEINIYNMKSWNSGGGDYRIL